MRILVLSCDKYSDAWGPFFHFFRKYWPDCPYEVCLATDLAPGPVSGPDHVFTAGKVGWNRILADFATACNDQPILLLLEDYFLTAPIDEWVIRHALITFTAHQAGCVRLYPCPGADGDPVSDSYGLITQSAPYRISCQAAIWDPAYLRTIASMTRSPWKFEIEGTRISRTMSQPLLAFRREVEPWPIEYLCTAIVRGKWQQDALDYCAREGVLVDTSRRPIELK